MTSSGNARPENAELERRVNRRQQRPQRNRCPPSGVVPSFVTISDLHRGQTIGVSFWHSDYAPHAAAREPWVQRFLPLFNEAARRYREPVGLDWRVDETYARIRGHWHYVYRAIDGRGQIVDTYVSPTRDVGAARTFFVRAIAATGTTPRRVITDRAAPYPPALSIAVPGVLHRTGRYRTNGIERDHGFLKERLRPMRGLKSVASATIFTRGYGLVRNIRRGFYRVVEAVRHRLVLAWTWNRLADAL
jgi:IS6 family transposase